MKKKLAMRILSAFLAANMAFFGICDYPAFAINNISQTEDIVTDIDDAKDTESDENDLKELEEVNDSESDTVFVSEDFKSISDNKIQNTTKNDIDDSEADELGLTDTNLDFDANNDKWYFTVNGKEVLYASYDSSNKTLFFESDSNHTYASTNLFNLVDQYKTNEKTTRLNTIKAELVNIKWARDGKPCFINTIAESAFQDCTSLTKVDFSECKNLYAGNGKELSLSAIEKFAFKGCTSLETVILRDEEGKVNVNRIDEYAFYNCNISEIIIPKSVNFIGSYAFAANTALKTVKLESANFGTGSTQSNYIFSGCSISKIIFADDTKNIPESLFKSAGLAFDSTHPLVIPASVEEIGAYAFNLTTGLEAVEFEKGSKLTKIGAYAFANSYGLSSFDFKNSSELLMIDTGGFTSSPLNTIDLEQNRKLATLGANAFANCVQATTVKLPSTLKNIGTNAFSACNALKNIDINFSTIGAGMFCNCANLSKINLISPSVIGNSAFKGCPSLIKIEIPECVTEIQASAFETCGLTEVSFKNSITEIPPRCFYGNVLLGSTASNINNKIELPKTIKTIGDGAFAGCEALHEITLPDAVEIIGSSAFAGTTLNSIVIPKNVKQIGTLAFNISNLSTIKIRTSVLESVGATPFGNGNKVSILEFEGMEKIPANFLHSMKFAANFEIVIPKCVKEIGDYAFGGSPTADGATDYAKITFEEGSQLETIGRYSFANNAVIDEITIPSSVKSIGEHAFDGCKKLKGCVIPENVTFLGVNAFANCESIGEIHYNAIEAIVGSPNGILYDNQGIFYNSIVHAAYIGPKVKTLPAGLLRGALFKKEGTDESLNITLVVPTTVTSLPAYALTQIKNVDKIILASDEFEEIGAFAFNGCSALEKIIINETVKFDEASGLYTRDESQDKVRLPKNLKKIGSNAFDGCEKLECVEIPEGVESIGARAFADCVLFDKVTIPEKLLQIEDETFNGCTALSEINFTGNNLFMIGGGAFENTAIEGLLDIPGGVKTIKDNAFSGCMKLTEVDLPSTLSSISTKAFTNSSVSKFYAGKDTYAEEWVKANYPGMLINKHKIIYKNIVKETDVNNNDESYRTGEDMVFAEPTREGYTFLGWFKDEALTVPIKSTALCDDDPLTVYASWKATTFKVTYNNLEGAIQNPDNPEFVDYGQPLKLLPASKRGFAFGGWFLNPELTMAWYDMTSVKEDITVYAKWNQLSYVIAYDPNGGKFKKDVPNRVTCVGDQWVSLLGEGGLSNGKKALVGWNTAADGTGENYEPGQAVMGLATKQNEEIKLYAVWAEDTYTIQYVLNKKTTVSANILNSSNKSFAAVGRDKKLLEAAYVNYPGYELTGWTTKKNGKGEKYEPGQIVKDLAESGKTIKLYPVYIMPTYTITYNYMDDEIDKAVPAKKVKTEYTAKKPAKFKKPKRPGYTFGGWYLQYDATLNKYSKKVSSSKNVGGNITLYAKWKDNVYSVSYDKNGGTVTTEGKVALKGKKNIKYNEEYTVLEVTEKLMARNGYTFDGWNTKKDGTGESYKSGQVVTKLIKKNKKKVKLYAQWK